MNNIDNSFKLTHFTGWAIICPHFCLLLLKYMLWIFAFSVTYDQYLFFILILFFTALNFIQIFLQGRYSCIQQFCLFQDLPFLYLMHKLHFSTSSCDNACLNVYTQLNFPPPQKKNKFNTFLSSHRSCTGMDKATIETDLKPRKDDVTDPLTMQQLINKFINMHQFKFCRSQSQKKSKLFE